MNVKLLTVMDYLVVRLQLRVIITFVILVFKHKDTEVIPLEVKCRELKDKTMARSLRGFVARYNPKEAWVVNLRLKEEEKMGGTRVRFIPLFELL